MTPTKPKQPPVPDAELTVEKLVYGGDGLSRTEGRVTLTPFTLPGETVAVQFQKSRTDVQRARPLTILTPSPHRAAPPCPYFGRCGGCHYQHATYEYQVEQKKDILREVMNRVGKIEIPAEIGALTADPLHYRNRSQFHFHNGRIGYMEAHSHRLVPITECPISSPRINELIGTLAAMARQPRWPEFLRSLELFTDEQSVQLNVTETTRPIARGFFDWCKARIPNLVEGSLDYPVGQRQFRVSHKSFFQVNRFLLEPLVAEALRDAEGQTAWDLYAGVGLFSIPLAQRFGKVTAVESGHSAVSDLQENARRANAQVETIASSTEAFLAQAESAPDFVLADPPRAGLGKQAVEQLIRLRPRQIAIVSCDPSTLARDVRSLLPAGYEIRRATLVDLFPQTYHLETLLLLTAR